MAKAEKLKEASVRVFRLYVRFANSKASMANTTLGVTLRLLNALDPAEQASIAEAKISCPKGVQACDIAWLSGEKKIVARAHFWDGSVKPLATDGWTNNPLSSAQVIEAVLNDVENNGEEVWGDVSVLHQNARDPAMWTSTVDQFNFDCLFSTRSEEADDAAARTSPAALAKRTEAQALFVSFSDEIPVRQ